MPENRKRTYGWWGSVSGRIILVSDVLLRQKSVALFQLTHFSSSVAKFPKFDADLFWKWCFSASWVCFWQCRVLGQCGSHLFTISSLPRKLKLFSNLISVRMRHSPLLLKQDWKRFLMHQKNAVKLLQFWPRIRFPPRMLNHSSFQSWQTTSNIRFSWCI